MKPEELHSLFLIENTNFSIFVMKAIKLLKAKENTIFMLRSDDAKEDFDFEKLLAKIATNPLDKVFVVNPGNNKATIFVKDDQRKAEKVV